AACGALAELGAAEAIEPLRQFLEHPSWQLRYAAAIALVDLEATDERLVAALQRLAEDPAGQAEPIVLQGIKLRLAQLRYAGANPGATDADGDEVGRRALDTALRELQDPDAEIRQQATFRLRDLGGPRAVEALIGALKGDPSVKARSAAALALGFLEAPEAV